jgi:hypothetical protein
MIPRQNGNTRHGTTFVTGLPLKNGSDLLNGNLPGRPDFGEGGIFKPPGGSKELFCGALQSDGAIIVAGLNRVSGFAHSVAVMRLTSAGAAETTMVLAQSGYAGLAYRAALQSDGKVLLAATLKKDSNNEEEFALIRLGTDLKPDTSFDGDGWLRRTSSNSVEARAVQVLTGAVHAPCATRLKRAEPIRDARKFGETPHFRFEMGVW